MSLDGLRDAYSREKKNEIQKCELSRKRKLRELYNYTRLLNVGHPPHPQDFIISDDPSEIESRFLDENEIAKGRRFNDSTLLYSPQNATLPTTLPFQPPVKSLPGALKIQSATPTLPSGAPASLEEQLRAASASPSVATQPLPSVEGRPDGLTPGAALPSKPRIDSTTKQEVDVAGPFTKEVAPNGSNVETQQPINANETATQNGDKQFEHLTTPSVDPRNNTPSNVDAVEDGPDATPGDGPRTPQVEHLPSKEIQDTRHKETERKLEKSKEKERKEDERLALPNGNGNNDVVSSPSSTVGPYSQATPHAPHHSPDTSPDSESFRDRPQAAAPDGVVANSEAQKAKEDHESALQLQLQEARQRARARSSETPDVERQIENEQAIRLARDGNIRQSESQPAPGTRALTEHAEEVVQEAVATMDVKLKENETLRDAAVDSLPTPRTIAPEPSGLDSESAESVPARPQQSNDARVEHPTPPADVDVDMDDTPIPSKEKEHTSAHQTSPSVQKSGSSSNPIGSRASLPDAAENVVIKSDPSPSSNTTALTRIEKTTHTDQKRKEVSTVIFAKPDSTRLSKAVQLYSEDYASLQGASEDSNRDYLQGLFKFQAHHPARSQPLGELVQSARKTLSTAGTLAMLRETQDYKILKRVYQLQNANRWSLRQLQKSAEPARPTSHLDHLLKEMKYMQTDFKEERKWKHALASTFANWCAEYVNSSSTVQAQLRIRARIPEQAEHASHGDADMNDAPTPDLVHSGANETESESFADDDELLSPLGSNPPAGLFSLGFGDVVMKFKRTPASETMLQELPFYDPQLEDATDVTPVSFCDPAILPVSKFVTGKLVSKIVGPPRKRSRYEFDLDEEPSTPPSRSGGTSAEHSMPSTPGRRLFHRNDLNPEMTDVALFNPENKHVRDRLQAAHQFRPPTEFLMPPVSFFESRNSSQWLWEEDQKLRSFVKEYTFNWSLVAQELTLPSQYVSASGRRTPWECFERWVQLEGLPAEMSKTPYFRTYQNRLEQAQRTVTAQHQAQQQMIQQQAQQGQNQATSAQVRRRTTHPIRVERRRDNRHLSIIDGMRKLARKRESAAHKSSEAAKAAALRKAAEPAQPKSNVQTPQEWSRMKWEREEKMKQKMQAQQAHQEMQMRAAMAAAQAQRQVGMQGQPGMANGMNQQQQQQQQQQRTGTPNNNVNMPNQLPNQVAHQGVPTPNGGMPNQQMPRQQPMQGNFPNSNMAGMAMNNAGVPQAQMQATMQNSQRMPPPDQVRMAMQRGQFPNSNQQQFQLQQQQINMASNLTASMGMGNNMPNANMLANMAGQNMNGNLNVAMNGMNNMNGMNGMNNMNGMSNNAGSPRLNQPQMQNPARSLSSGHVPHLLQMQNNIKAQYPEWTQEQVSKAASEQLTRIMAKQQRAQAMNAAAGAASGMASSPQLGNNMYLQNNGMQNNGVPNSPSPNAVQNYQNQLLQQQRMMSQQRPGAGSPSINAARPVSRSATPQNPQLGIQSPGPQQQQQQAPTARSQ